jgi:uncharacterized membrane protein YuzA (DUF378 family)
MSMLLIGLSFQRKDDDSSPPVPEARSRAPPTSRRRLLVEPEMKPLNLITLILIIVGGLNWGMVGLFHVDVVASIFGSGSVLTRLIYILVGLSALWQIVPLVSAFSTGEVAAERALHH